MVETKRPRGDYYTWKGEAVGDAYTFLKMSKLIRTMAEWCWKGGICKLGKQRHEIDSDELAPVQFYEICTVDIIKYLA